MIRAVDFLFAFFGIIFLWPVFCVIFILCLFDTGSPVFIQERVGKHKKPFKLIKFRTMNVNTKSVATHLTDKASVTKLGVFLRNSKMDELPQLINVLMGSMSIVGPRPSLFSQDEVILERDKLGVHNVTPGITGLSQIQGIDMSRPYELAVSDAEMIRNFSLPNYFKYIFATVGGKGQGDRIVKK
ncbi:lipid carrier--UDP-N-acetylgalactosaminyltransferase [Chryseobacterium sp. Leaf404]|uniref:sugar transferase n=1 Tax=unclassified Chryseobacterium TaxID=2593645 RepID=UPI0006FD7477|nr:MULTISPECIES: sugar transferase [unclassified Chryseobacterium]KQT17901.1 lipid carrier--UDP-N-acetylgalactosaminyltransferase [Chryseobacterium sp. Leaf404]